MAQPNTTLDADELVALAVRASQAGKSEEALRYLEHALEQDPDNGPAHHMLGGIYAEMNRFDLAIEEMQRAVEFDADPAPARFELGMMYITTAHISKAHTAWEPLDALGEDHSLFLFARGMRHLVKNEFDDCVADIERGISLNKANLPLNDEMQKVVARVKKARGA